VVRSFERQELDVEGFQWAGVFKPTADVDDSFALAEPPAHDDWVPQAILDKNKRSEVRMALIRIREAADTYLSPRKLTIGSSEAPPSAAHVGDMLADLLSGLEGPAPSNRVAPLGLGDTGSGASSGTTAPVGTANETASISSTGTAPPLPPGSMRVGAVGPASSTSASTRIFPGAGAGRPTGRPRVIVVAASHEPARSPGWTRTTLDVQLANGSPAASAVDVSVRVGYDGGSMEDTGVVRIIGWSGASDDTFAPGPTDLTPDVVRQFVFEARSDLAIDVEPKLGDR